MHKYAITPAAIRRRALPAVACTVIGALLAACAGDSIVSNSSTSTVTNDVTGCGSTTTLNAGQVVAGLTGTAVCLSGGASGAEYALVAFNGSTDAASTSSLAVQATGTTAVTSSLTATADLIGAGSLASSAALYSASRSTLTARLHAQLRAIEARELTPRIAGARAWNSARQTGGGALRSVIPATITVGQLVSLNANANQACTSPRMRTARVVAVGSKAIVVADTGNPTGGFTDAEYQAIGQTFDTVVDPSDTKNFGQPSDIDGNGHVILFFTRAVNELTPANSDSYVGGFFFARDLFPTTATANLEACPGSNVGEMFYLMVPDPTGVVNNNKFSKASVTSGTISTLAHEYQHLINASRRLYVNTAANDFEDTWLDEGLAHVAEELLFYARSGLTSRQNIDVTKLRTSSTYLSAFNDDAIANFGRFDLFLQSPSLNSPYADNDSLETRGATWSFLRWAADHQSADESSVWYQLVNSTTTGLNTLRRVYGSDLTPLFRDWATSMLMDDVAGTDARYQQPSWNFRSIYAALNSGGYRLKTVSLASGTPATVRLLGGGSAFLRFGVGAGAMGAVTWGTLPAGVQVSVVRTR